MENIFLSSLILWLFSWWFVTVDNLIDDTIEYVRYNILKIKVHKSSGDVFADLKNTPLREAYLNVYRFFNTIKEFPFNAYDETKWFIQRGIRGYSDRDVWGFDCYLMTVIKEGLLKLQKNKQGYPMLVIEDSDPIDEHGNLTEEGDKLASERWNKVLQVMINTFHTAELINEGKYAYIPSENWTLENYNKQREIYSNSRYSDETIVMSLEDSKRYELGFDYFKKYFFCLWD